MLGSLSILTKGWTILVLHRVRPRRGRPRLVDGAGRVESGERPESPDDGAADRDRRRLLGRRRVDLPRPAEPRLRHVRGRHDLVPHAVRGAVRPGRVDDPAPFHRPAAARRLVLPGQLGADPRQRDRPLRHRLALAADQPDLALDRAAGGLVHRPPLQGRPGDPGRLGARLLGRGDDRNPARRGAQRHHGPRLPDRLRRVPDQRPSAPRAPTPGRSRTHPRAMRPCSTGAR